MRRSAWGLALLCIGLGVPAVSAQEPRNCELAQSRVARPIAQPDDTYIVFVSQPVFRCSDGAEIRSDSAALYEATGFSMFFRQVYFRDGTRTLQSDAARYFDASDRLLADGNVRVTDASDGTVITGENLTLLRAGAERTEDILEMRGGSPHARLTPKPVEPTPVEEAVDTMAAGGDTIAQAEAPPESPIDTVSAPPDSTVTESPESPEPLEAPAPREPKPIDLDAFEIVLIGDRMVHAAGRVRITQDSLQAFGDSMAFSQTEGILELFENARMIAPGEGADTLDLRGDTIVARMPGGNIEEVEARRRGRLLGVDVAIVGPRVRLHFTPTDEVDRVVSVVAPEPEASEDEAAAEPEPVDSVTALAPPPSRPEASAEEYVITADSIEVSTPGGEVETVYGSGRARAVSTARDTLNTEDTPEILRNDWIEGAEITAYFVPADSTPAQEDPAEASDGRYRIERIVAVGSARSLSRFSPDSAQSDTTQGQAPGLSANYVLGDEIRIFLVDGEADRMEVDNAEGIVIQPQARARVIQPDSIVEARPDTTRGPVGPGPGGGRLPR
jgi:lipopolysaccharide export system protein LptA